MRLSKNKIQLPLNQTQSSIRIADSSGNHVRSPTQAIRDPNYFAEWMIRNSEITSLVKNFLTLDEKQQLLKRIKKVSNFVGDSKYSKRKAVRLSHRKKGEYAGFKIFQYTEKFSSFEKELDSGLRVRITFKLGDYGVEPHPHMYVLVPFKRRIVQIKNNLGEVQIGEKMGSGCLAELTLKKPDICEIVITLSHASVDHKEALIKEISSI